jgi:prophage antirepressor-like protein
MNALIDLEQSREYMTVEVGGKNHLVKLAGTIDIPYFCGKNICDVLGYQDSKTAIKKFVEEEDRSNLENLMALFNPTVGGAICPPHDMVDGNHLGQKNYSFREGQIVYINESGLYSLILSSHAPFAKEFKRLVCKTILPSIRKFGSFQVESQLANAVAQLTIKDKSHEEETTELKYRAEKLESQLEEQRLLKEKAEIEAKEKLQRALKFNQATKQVEPQEYIYIATTDQYMVETKFKPGGCGTFDLVKSRLSQYNSGKSDSNSHFFVYLRKVVSYRAIEQALAATLGGFRENANKELYIINYDWLVKCLDAIIDHNAEFLLFVNLNRNQMVEDTMNREPVIMAPLRLEKIRVTYQRIGEEEVELTTILEQDTIDAIKDAMVVFNPDNNVVKRVAFENHLKESHPEVKIDQRKRIIWDIVKKIGVSINPRWRYKY